MSRAIGSSHAYLFVVQVSILVNVGEAPNLTQEGKFQPRFRKHLHTGMKCKGKRHHAQNVACHACHKRTAFTASPLSLPSTGFALAKMFL
jgi:hypothetical protein